MNESDLTPLNFACYSMGVAAIIGAVAALIRAIGVVANPK